MIVGLDWFCRGPSAHLAGKLTLPTQANELPCGFNDLCLAFDKGLLSWLFFETFLLSCSFTASPNSHSTALGYWLLGRMDELKASWGSIF